MTMHMSLFLRLIGCIAALWLASAEIVANVCEDWDVRLVDTWVSDETIGGNPEVFLGGSFHPICGEQFTNSVLGVQRICERLGHFDGDFADSAGETVGAPAAFIPTTECSGESLGTCSSPSQAFATGSLSVPACAQGVGQKLTILCVHSSASSRSQSCSTQCDTLYRNNPMESSRSYSLSDPGVTSMLSTSASQGWTVAPSFEGPESTCSGIFQGQSAPRYSSFTIVSFLSYARVDADDGWIEFDLTGCASGLYRISTVFRVGGTDPGEKEVEVQITNQNSLTVEYEEEWFLFEEVQYSSGWFVHDEHVYLDGDAHVLRYTVPEASPRLDINAILVLKVAMQVPQLPGHWYASSRQGATCYEVCDSYALEFDWESSWHTGSDVVGYFFSHASVAGTRAGFECATSSALYGSDGSEPDGGQSFSGCHLVCACRSFEGELNLQARSFLAGSSKWYQADETGRYELLDRAAEIPSAVAYDREEQAFVFDGNAVMTVPLKTSSMRTLTFSVWLQVPDNALAGGTQGWVLAQSGVGGSTNVRALSLSDFVWDGGSPPGNEMLHLVVTWSETTREVYVDGEWNGWINFTFAEVEDGGSDEVLVIGGRRASDAAYNIDGLRISDILVYNWSMSEFEVQALHELGRPSSAEFEESLTIDLSGTREIAGFMTQGSLASERWMTRYYVRYGDEGGSWTDLEGPYRGNWNFEASFAVLLPPETSLTARSARYLEIVNKQRNLQGLRAGVLTCEPPDVPWEIRSGSCTVTEEGCLQTPFYPSSYPDNSECTIAVLRDVALRVEDFSVERGYDFLVIDGNEYDEGSNVNGRVLGSGEEMQWTTDVNTASRGFRICPGCWRGQFRDAVQDSCEDCEIGRFSDVLDVDECEVCPPGKFGDEAGLTECGSCPAGQGPNENGVCEACATGRHAVDGICEECEAGWFNDVAGQACQECAPGQFADTTGFTACESCLAGSYSETGASDCTACPPGTYGENPSSSACTNCTGGTSSTASGAVTAATCLACQSGRFSDAGSGECDPCPRGYFQEFGGRDACEACDIGRFMADTAATACVDCPQGRYNDVVGQLICAACALGRYGPSTAAIALSECLECPGGKFSDVDAAIAELQCTNCATGRYSDAGAAECETCATGRYNPSEGSAGSTSCLACEAGRAGPEVSLSACVICENGTYAPVAADNCLDCRSGYFSEREAEECDPCPSGTYSSPPSCTLCPAGRYNEGVAGDDIGACRLCPAGKSSAEGSDSASSCVDCDAGRFSEQGGACERCPDGQFADSTGSQACEDCAVGRYMNLSAATVADACVICPQGSVADERGLGECTFCTGGRTSSEPDRSVCVQCGSGRFSSEGDPTCSDCPAGRFTESDEQANACLACEAGRFADNDGLTACSTCGPGQYSEDGADRCTDCESGSYQEQSLSSACVACPAGTHGQGTGFTDDSACVQCSAGKFNPDEGQPSVDDCEDCSPGTFSSAGAPTCSECEVGRYNPDFARTSDSFCLACPAGTYTGSLTGRGSLNDCLDCSPGDFSDAGSETCSPCPEGSYSSQDGSATCTPCEAGRFSDSTRSTACDLCARGTYRDPVEDGSVGSSTACTLCPVGRFGNQTEAPLLSFCEACPRGTAISSEGATACIACAVNTYASVEGLSACAACSSGDYSIEGAIQCCPGDDDDFPSDSSGSLNTPPGKSATGIHVLPSCDAESSVKLAQGAYNTQESTIGLATFSGGNQESCVDMRCDGCYLEVVLPQDDLELGDRVLIRAQIEYANAGDFEPMWHTCSDQAAVGIVGFGCAADTLRAFFLALISVIGFTVLMGLGLNAYERARVKVFLQCSLDVALPASAKENLPTELLLWETIAKGLRELSGEKGFRFNPHRDLPRHRFLAFERSLPDGSLMLHLEFAVHAARGRHNDLRRILLRNSWTSNPEVALWHTAKVQQQPPVIVKAAGQTPGMDLVDCLEHYVIGCCTKTTQESKQLESDRLHAEVAEALLSGLTRWWALTLLFIQYVLGICALGLLPFYASTLEWSCDEGYPIRVHWMWGGYMTFSGMVSLFILFMFGGKKSWIFIRKFKGSLLLNFIFMFFLHMDAYQDVTFPVIADKCNFDLWFVSAWLVVLGVGVMQIIQQVLVLIAGLWSYIHARTPEERERLAVEGVFLALRGSDNLLLVHAIKPAVSEHLGGASSWAMKTSEARISFCRFFFEDVEQSALQAVFLIFYDASAGDKGWVTGSIAMSLLLSFTLVVQVLPEVRDWLWHRLLTKFFGGTRYRFVRAVWLVVLVVLYRAIYAFPWISACSPSGDVCTEGDEAGYMKILNYIGWSCRGGETYLFGLRAKESEAQEVGLVSALCVGGFLITALLASIVWGIGSFRQRQKNRSAVSREKYSVAERLNKEVEVLRPKGIEDDDPWLQPAREIRKAALKMLETHKTDKDMARLVRQVEAVDHMSFCFSRDIPQRRLRAVLFPCCFREGELKRKLAKIRGSPALPPLGAEVTAAAEALRIEATHTATLSIVKHNVKLCLTHRRFLRGDVWLKADWIDKATAKWSPLRLVHWSTLEELGTLPKFGSAKGAVDVAEAIRRTAARTGVPVEKAERHLVPFFFSHRWLRTTGPQERHHPDSIDNVKARSLVMFAKWFMERATKAGLKCEVFFWIDWCCCEQDDPQATQIGIAALPLYIAACMKIVSWRTADFDQRSWLMVERLLAYSFCTGGLMPYAVDENLAPPLAENADGALGADGLRSNPITQQASAGAAASASAGPPVASQTSHELPAPSTIWEIQVQGGAWQKYDDTAQAALQLARQRGDPTVDFEAGGNKYQVNILRMVQRNVATGKERPVREVKVKTPKSSKKDLLQQSSQPSQPSAPENPRQSASGQLQPLEEVKLRRRVRKLPNPLDWEACQVTRTSDRRVIAELVKTALTIPALEVFADRQPVEWGLTEVVEQSLVPGNPLPFESSASEEIQKLPWLKPVEAKASSWRLIVVTAEDLRKRRYNHDADALIWSDNGIETLASEPTEDEVEKSFEAVDEAFLNDKSQLDKAVKDLIVKLKTLMESALATGDTNKMEVALALARDVQLPMRQKLTEEMCAQRLYTALTSGSEAEMRNALRIAQEWGCDRIEAYNEVAEAHQKLYRQQLEDRLSQQLSDALERDPLDLASLAKIHFVGAKHHLDSAALAYQAAFDYFDGCRKRGDSTKANEIHIEVTQLRWVELQQGIELALAMDELKQKISRHRQGKLRTAAPVIQRAAQPKADPAPTPSIGDSIKAEEADTAKAPPAAESKEEDKEKTEEKKDDVEDTVVADEKSVPAEEPGDTLPKATGDLASVGTGTEIGEAGLASREEPADPSAAAAPSAVGAAAADAPAAQSWEEAAPPIEEEDQHQDPVSPRTTQELLRSVGALREIERRATQLGLLSIREEAKAALADTLVDTTQALPQGWDLVSDLLSGTRDRAADALLKKTEETDQVLIKQMQDLVDSTFRSWGAAGIKVGTRDRRGEICAKLKVQSVTYVQNYEAYINYTARMKDIRDDLTKSPDDGRDWKVKTADKAPTSGRRMQPVDPTINEFYLWHGTGPKGAEGITDTEFDLKRAGTAAGILFGAGLYFAESCMKSDEYTQPDERSYYPLILCRVLLGKVKYCDHPNPTEVRHELEASCKTGGGYHSVLGDREKIKGTFREFIVYDNHQVYPEYIVWYSRESS